MTERKKPTAKRSVSKEEKKVKKVTRKPLAAKKTSSKRVGAKKVSTTRKVVSKSVKKRLNAQGQKASVKAPKTPRKSKALLESPETEGEFYKAFKHDGNGELFSASITGVFGLRYPVGQKTFAKPEMVKAGFGLMLFRNLEDAKRWSGGTVYKVRVGKVFDVPKKRLHRNVSHYLGRPGIGEYAKYLFYKQDKGGLLPEDFSWDTVVASMLEKLDVEDSWPRGTVMTDWVIPVERVRY